MEFREGAFDFQTSQQNLSKQAVWQKIKKESSIDLRQFTSKKGNTVYVDVDGQKAIKNAFFNKTSTKKRQQKVFIDDNVNDSIYSVSEEKKEIHKLLDQQQRLALQYKKLLEEYKQEINELKSLMVPVREDEKESVARKSNDIDKIKEEPQKKNKKWWHFGRM